MARFTKGDIVIVNFPYTDQTDFKRRPALIIIVPPGNNVVIVQITSQDRGPYPIPIIQADLTTGTLNQQSYVQPDVIVTVNESIIYGKAGSLKQKKMDEVINKIVELLKK
nr:type II toxin-antitoxin system PemK/MazF family toxin [Candidatus Sigynarchaeum springense]